MLANKYTTNYEVMNILKSKKLPHQQRREKRLNEKLEWNTVPNRRIKLE